MAKTISGFNSDCIIRKYAHGLLLYYLVPIAGQFRQK